ncbi:MAG: archaellin/type IV pilin N-terminal domain-containing protein [Nanoarchaeota archaeon]|nr:type IV pilin [Nanoarchaeota archaeon]MBU4300226.1 type IV pilin [Nanoarchaeota archaeon]MBU4451612.1 type IV pilin [Nanoarchaeota archaeon]MCG2723134.1 type IV pilin [archaeon]
MRILKGVSPLIASVLLIAFTMAIAAVLTAWISGFTTAQREKTAVFEEKIACNYGFIENDIDFTEYNYTDDTTAFFKTRLKNTGTIDLSIGRYQTWFEDSSVPLVWTIDNPGNNTAIKKLNDKILTFNVSGGRLIKIKIIGHICDGITATVSEPLGGWNRGPTLESDAVPLKE